MGVDREKMMREVARLRDDEMATDVEMSFCSHCGESFTDREPVYQLRVPGGHQEDEWEVSDCYCRRCVLLDPRRKKPAGSPHPSDG